MLQPLLEGRIESEEETFLRRKVEQLEKELADTQQKLRDARSDSLKTERPLREFRRVLGPLHQVLKMLFDESDAVLVNDEAKSGVGPKVNAVWESWKSRFGGGTAKVIDALLLHGEMNTTQLSIATGLHRTTIPALIFKLNKASLINKNGGRFSLKEL